MPSPRWRKRWKALRRAQSPIMLSLNLPRILIFTRRQSPRERLAHKKKARPAQKTASNRRDHAKIVPPAQRCGGQKRSNSAGILRETDEPPTFRNISEMAVREALQRYLPALRVQKLRNRRSGDHSSYRGYGHPGPRCGLRERLEAILRNCA